MATSPREKSATEPTSWWLRGLGGLLLTCALGACLFLCMLVSALEDSRPTNAALRMAERAARPEARAAAQALLTDQAFLERNAAWGYPGLRWDAVAPVSSQPSWRDLPVELRDIGSVARITSEGVLHLSGSPSWGDAYGVTILGPASTWTAPRRTSPSQYESGYWQVEPGLWAHASDHP